VHQWRYLKGLQIGVGDEGFVPKEGCCVMLSQCCVMLCDAAMMLSRHCVMLAGCCVMLARCCRDAV
jgi:hypothetical protein